MKNLIVGFLIGWLALIGCVFAFITLGGMPVRTKGPPLPLERWVAHTALRAAIGGERNVPSPLPADEENLNRGARLYRQHCAVCHGLPQHPPTAIAEGLFPPPPALFEHGVDDDPVGVIYWKIKNGIRLTGMPGFEGRFSEQELWQVTLFLHSGPAASASVFEKIDGK